MKKVNIAAKLRESSPEGKVLSAPTISMLAAQGVIAVEQELSDGKKQLSHGGSTICISKWHSDGGICCDGTHDPED